MNNFALVALLTSIAAAQAPAVDWDKHKAETLAHYRALVQIDTSNPPGNETRVVEYLEEGARGRRHPDQDVRARSRIAPNLVARLKGNGASGRC